MSTASTNEEEKETAHLFELVQTGLRLARPLDALRLFERFPRVPVLDHTAHIDGKDRVVKGVVLQSEKNQSARRGRRREARKAYSHKVDAGSVKLIDGEERLAVATTVVDADRWRVVVRNGEERSAVVLAVNPGTDARDVGELEDVDHICIGADDQYEEERRKKKDLRTEVLDVKHLRTSLNLQSLRGLSSIIRTERSAVLAVVGDAEVEDRGEMGAVELDELDADGLLLPELEDTVD